MPNIRRYAVACFFIYIIQTTTSDCPFPRKEQIPNGRYVYRAPGHANWKIAPENYPLHFRCSRGFIKRGAVTSFCRNGRWTRPVPKCLAMKCTDPPEILNGKYTLASGSKDLTVGTIATYNCDSGRELENSINSVLTCTFLKGNNKMFWNGTTPRCISKKDKPTTTDKAIKCPEPPAILNGDYKLNNGSNGALTIGTTAIYTCDTEFEFDKSTDSVLTCTLRSNINEAFWKGTRPACICKTE